MIRLFIISLLFLISSIGYLRGADPTPNRSWKSAAGTSIEAKATDLAGEVVTLETPTGRLLKVELAKLSEDDQAFLETHFGASTEIAAPLASPHPQGTTVGPIKAEESSYYLYLPKSLMAGQKAPLLFITGSGGGSPGGLDSMIEGAEICGWIVAMSVESKNGLEGDPYHGFAKQCIDHLSTTLPVDPGRIYFGGDSGGSRVAFQNSAKIDTAGVLAIIAGSKPEELSRKKHYFFINGATDYNRYGSAASYAEVKANSTIRFHPGAHAQGPSWLVTEGIVWLEAKMA